MKKNEYFYGLDFLRAILMLIGVLIHYAAMISPYHIWRYHSYNHESSFFYHLFYFTHFFRMETFFILAGFFSLLIYSKKGKSEFLENRLNRVLTPFIFSCFTVSIFCLYLNYWIYSAVEVTLNNIIMHFWFLLTLFLISLFFYYFKLDGIKRKIIFFSLLLLINVFIFLRYLILSKIGSESLYYQLFNYLIFNSVYFGFFFYLGWSIYFLRDILKGYNYNNFYIFFTIVALLLVSAYFNFYTLENININMYEKIFFKIFENLTTISTALGLFFIFLKINFYNNFVKYLVDSSIIVYIFHFPFLIFYGYLYDSIVDNTIYYFFLVVISTYISAFLTYEIIKRIKFLSRIYGLKSK